MQRNIFWHTVPLTALALVASLAVAGCAVSGQGTASTTPTGTAQVHNCGHLQSRVGGGPGGGANPPVESALSCFWNAYQHCEPAQVTYTTVGVDTGNIYTFTLQHQSSGCTLTDAHDRFIAPNPARPVGTYTCSGLQREQDGSLIAQNCGQDGNVTLPASAQQTSTSTPIP